MKCCSKCKVDLNKGGQSYHTVGNDYYCMNCLECSFCKKKLTSEVLTSPDKPGVMACKECEKELQKPIGYDPNAKATCKCGKKSEPAWRWNGNSWEYHPRILDADCCSMLTDKCKCGADKNKGESLCSKCIEREREREREQNQNKPDFSSKFEKGNCCKCKKEDWIGKLWRECIDCWYTRVRSGIVSFLKSGGQPKVLQSHWEKDKPKENEIGELKKLDSDAGQRLEQKVKDLEKEIYADKPTDDGKKSPNPNEVCEKCGASCIVHQTKTSYTVKRKRYIKHKTDFARESSVWFGTNCDCARQFREANQQTCPQCKKREFPHMKRGWLLDYEIKKAFCSPLCHVTYREMKWEEAQRLSRVEMFPPELDVEVNPQQNTNWEQQGLRNEVLFLREMARELEQRLRSSSNLTPEERLQSNYLRNLQQNTLQNAENSYKNKYGSLVEDNSKGNNKNKGLSGGIIVLIVIGVIIVVSVVIGLVWWRKKKK